MVCDFVCLWLAIAKTGHCLKSEKRRRRLKFQAAFDFAKILAMSIVLELPPAFEAKVTAAALARGLSAEQFALEALIDKTPLSPEELEEIEDAHDIAVAEYRLANPVTDEPYRTLDDLRRHLGR